MAGNARTKRAGIRLRKETLWGEDPPGSPTGAIQQIRKRAGLLTPTKETTESELIREGRQVEDLPEVAAAAGGNFGIELVYGDDFHLLLEGILQNTFTTIDETGLDLSVAIDTPVAGQATITRAAGDFVADGVVVRQCVRFKNMQQAANNVTKRVISVVAGSIVVDNAVDVMVVQAGGPATGDYHVNSIRNGVVDTSFLAEQFFGGPDLYETYTGVIPTQMDLSIQSGSTIAGTIQLLAKRVYTNLQSAASVTAAPATKSVTGTANITRLVRAGAVLGVPVRGLTLSMANNLEAEPYLGSKFPLGYAPDVFRTTGQLQAYMPDLDLVDDFVNHAESAIEAWIRDGQQNDMIIDVPRFSSTDPGRDDSQASIIQTAGFLAQRHSEDYTIQFDMLGA